MPRRRSDALQWRHNERHSVSNHQHHDCLPNRLFRRRSKKISKLRVTGLCAGNSPVTGEFPAQRAGNTENVSSWWRHHGLPNSPLITRTDADKQYCLQSIEQISCVFVLDTKIYQTTFPWIPTPLLKTKCHMNWFPIHLSNIVLNTLRPLTPFEPHVFSLQIMLLKAIKMCLSGPSFPNTIRETQVVQVREPFGQIITPVWGAKLIFSWYPVLVMDRNMSHGQFKKIYLETKCCNRFLIALLVLWQPNCIMKSFEVILAIHDKSCTQFCFILFRFSYIFVMGAIKPRAELFLEVHILKQIELCKYSIIVCIPLLSASICCIQTCSYWLDKIWIIHVQFSDTQAQMNYTISIWTCNRTWLTLIKSEWTYKYFVSINPFGIANCH